MAITLILRFEILTPLFLGGADQSPELRASSFKGLLRFWYRAADPAFANRDGRGGGPCREERFFGGSSDGAGQSPFLLQVTPGKVERLSWTALRPRRFDEGTGKQAKNGLVYLGFPFQMRGGEREAFAPKGTEIELRCIVTREEANETFRQALLASWWLLGHLGSAGSRSRRGFGGLALREWRFDPADAAWPELERLPLLCTWSEPAGWRAGFEATLSIFQAWFGPYAGNTRHPHLGPRFRWVLTDEGFPTDRWDEALAAMGLRLQKFRYCKPPDYADVKDHLRAAARQGGQPLRNAPERATFGLPLTFRYAGLPGSVIFTPFDEAARATRERQGSLLLLRLAAIGNQVHPLFLRLDGEVPGLNGSVAVRGRGRSLYPAKGNALDEFMLSLQQEP